MKQNEREIDLKRAFAAPPESYVRRTRETLDSLEEAENVKKAAWGTVLAIACALVLMTTAFAAGINNLRSRDNIAGQSLSQGGTPALNTDAARAVDNDVDISVLDAQFDGEYLYMNFEVRGNEAYQKRALDLENGYALSITVNGKTAFPMVSNFAVQGDYLTTCAGVYKCDAADTADVSIYMGNAEIGKTVRTQVQAGNSIQRCRVYQNADANLPEPVESFALMGDNFKMVHVKYESGAWLGNASLDVSNDSSNLTQYIDENGACTWNILLCGETVPTVKLRVNSGEQGMAERTVVFDISPMTEATPAHTYNTEAQFDGELLHLRVETDESVDMNVTVNNETPELLGGVNTIQHADDSDAVSYVYDLVYRCLPADLAQVRVVTHTETDAGFSMLVNASDTMKQSGLEWLGANVPDGFDGYAINGSGFGMAVLGFDAECENAPGTGTDYSLNVGGVQANISDYYIEDKGLRCMVVYMSDSYLPQRFVLAGSNGYDDIELGLSDIGDAREIDTLDAEQTNAGISGIALTVEKAYRVGDDVYALVGITPENGKTARWSSRIDKITDEINALENSAEAQDVGQKLYDLTCEYMAVLQELIQPDDSAETQIIGGADGSTRINIVSETSAGIIGGVDGPTGIYIKNGSEEASEVNASGSGIIGGADGSTGINIVSETSAGIIGGADGPTDIYIKGFGGICLVKKPELLVNGKAATLCIDDVSEALKCQDGTLMLALVCEASKSDSIKLSVIVDERELTLDVYAQDWQSDNYEDWMKVVDPYKMDDSITIN